MPTSHADPSIRYRRLALAGCLLAILGAKFLLIAYFGIPVPYWDQWDAEAVALYQHYLTNTMGSWQWFGFHNEHRILFTRVSALLLLWLNGTWDPIVQMLFNAMVHVAAIGLLVYLLGRLLDLASFLVFAAFALVAFAVPFGWDNTLGGFQVQFYYLVLTSILALALLYPAPAWSARWLAGTMVATAGYFAMASGALILPAAIALAAMQVFAGARRGPREVAGIVLHAMLTLVLLHDALSYSPHEVARSASTVIGSFLVSASWPIAAASWPTVLRIIPPALINAPVLIIAARVMAGRSARDDRRWFALALGAWFVLQIAALSYGRPGGTPESRYADIFLIGTLINAAVWLYLLRRDAGPYHRTMLALASVWLFAVLLGAGQKAANNVTDGITARVQTGRIQTDNVKNYLATGDFAHLSGKPFMHIPYPSAERLRDILSDRKLRAILPAAITGADEPRGVKSALLAAGPMLLPLGIVLLIAAALAAFVRRGRTLSDPL